ncbi:MAG TPA: hypothetical protein PLP87_04950, partial [Clostridiales bacterium]|nr:hypothetical protein [Clostridiales bacterium]
MKNKLTLTGANVLLFIFTVVLLAYQFIASFILGEAISGYMYAIVIINQLLIVSSAVVYCIVKK